MKGKLTAVMGLGMLVLGGYNVTEDVKHHAPMGSLILSGLLVALGAFMVIGVVYINRKPRKR